MTGGPSEWDVRIDGALLPKLVLTPGANDYVLASGLAPGVHTVELYKRSEAQNGATRFVGFDFGGGALKAPPPRAKRTIEVVGDSQAAAYGVDGVGIPCTGTPGASRWENFRESFGAVLGVKLGADVIGTVASGAGVVRNIWRPDPDTMPVRYLLANPVDATSGDDAATYAPDVVVIQLGINDFAAGQPMPDATPLGEAEFEAGYDAFVSTIRAKHPSAHVFLVLPPDASDTYPAGHQARTNIATAIAHIVANRHDAHVHSATPAQATADELTGCDGHGDPAYHVRVANELAAVIVPVLGW